MFRGEAATTYLYNKKNLLFDPTGVRAHDLRTRDQPANHYTVDVVRGIIPVLYLTRLIYVNLENSFMKILFCT